MYSSNLNINIHWAFVTFKILLDALQSIPFQISTSNYAFKLITTDQRLLIVFGAHSVQPCRHPQHMQLGTGDNARRPLSGPDFAHWSQSSGWPCPGHCTLSQCSPTWRWMTDWAPESSSVYASLQPNNAGAKRSETGLGQLGWGKVCSLLLKCLCEDFGVKRRHPERSSSILTCNGYGERWLHS